MKLKLYFTLLLLLTNHLHLNAVNLQEYLKNREGMNHIKNGLGTKAINTYSDIVSSENITGELHNNFGQAFYLERDYDSAEQYFNKALPLLPAEKQAKVLYNLGNVSFEKNEFNKAISHYIESLEINPNNNNAKHNLELALQKLKESKSNQDQESKKSEEQQKDDKKNESKINEKEQNKDQQSEQLKQEEQKDKEQQKRQAEQILNALEQREQQARKNMNKKKLNKVDIDYDW